MILIKQFQSLLSIKTAENSDVKMQANGRDLYLVSKHQSYLDFNQRFRERLEQYEDALSRCKTSSSKEACELADTLQVECDDFKQRTKYFTKNKAIAELVSKYEQLYYQHHVNEFEKKIKKYEDLLDYISKSKSETEWKEVENLLDEILDINFKIRKELGGLSESDAHLERKRMNLNEKLKEVYANQMFDNGFKPFREKLEQYEDALNRCKTSSSKEACELANTLQVECDNFADNAKDPTYGAKQPLIENKAIADLVTKYERLFQEHKEMKNPTKLNTVFRHRPPTGSNVARLAAIFNNLKKGGGKNTKRKRRQNRKRKSAKKII
jgi:hypothetical protein